MILEPCVPALTATLALAALASPLTASAHTETCRATSEKQVAGLFDRWNASLQTGDPMKVVANYAAKSILLPTVSNKPRLTADEKADYFEHFLARKPVGAIDSRSIEIDCNTAIDAGLYTSSSVTVRKSRPATASPTSGTARIGSSPATIPRRCPRRRAERRLGATPAALPSVARLLSKRFDEAGARSPGLRWVHWRRSSKACRFNEAGARSPG